MRTFAKLTRGGAVAAVSIVAVTATACGSDPSPVVDVKTISGGTTSVKLDNAFTTQLTDLKVTPSASGGAKLDLTGGTFTVPVSGGSLRVYKKGDVTPVVQGEIDHDKAAGLTLKAASTTVTLTNLRVDPSTRARLFADVAVDGKSSKTGFAVFDLDSGSIQQPSVGSGTVTLTSTTVKLDGGAAKLLNDTFKVDTLKGNALVGRATVQVVTK